MLDAVDRERRVAVRSAVVDDDVGGLCEPEPRGMPGRERARIVDRRDRDRPETAIGGLPAELDGEGRGPGDAAEDEDIAGPRTAGRQRRRDELGMAASAAAASTSRTGCGSSTTQLDPERDKCRQPAGPVDQLVGDEMPRIEHVDDAAVTDRRRARLRGGLDRVADPMRKISEAIEQIVEVSVDRGHMFTSRMTRLAIPTAGRQVSRARRAFG